MSSSNQIREDRMKKETTMRRFALSKRARQRALVNFILSSAESAKQLERALNLEDAAQFESQQIEEFTAHIEKIICTHMIESLGVEFPPRRTDTRFVMSENPMCFGRYAEIKSGENDCLRCPVLDE